MRGLRPAFLLSAAVLGLAGCGGGESDEAGGGGATDVTLADFSIEPSLIDVEEASEVTFNVRNDGDVAHALMVEGESTGTLAPGESGEVTVELAAGTYKIFCPVDGHSEQGMSATLTVAGGGAGGGGTTTGEDEDTGGYGYG